MKRAFVIFLIAVCCVIFFAGCEDTSSYQQTLIRIHIRANSNSTADQQIKLTIRDIVVREMTPLLSECKTTDQAKSVLKANLRRIEALAKNALAQAGFEYGAKAKLNNEYFPARMYEGIVVESGYYDALIIELGQAKGDNWWCVVYPPLCFVGATPSDSIKYKSLIEELWRKYIGK